MVGALDADPARFTTLFELLAKTDPATLATALDQLSNRNTYTDADKALVQQLTKYKNEHATGAALEAAYPAASQQSDAWAQVEETDSVWVIDADTGLWKNSNSSTAPANVDSALSKASTNAVSNQAIATALEQRHVDQIYPIPGDGTLVSFNITHSLQSVSGAVVRRPVSEEAVAVKAVRASASVYTVGPFAVPPADNAVFEIVLTGKVAI